MSAGWYETSGPSKGWKPSGVGEEDASKSARARAAAERVFLTVHGTHMRYNAGCRCDECREAERGYRATQYRRPGVQEAEREKARARYESDPEFRAKRLRWNRESRRRKAAERRGGQ